jgi:hypothetical protein
MPQDSMWQGILKFFLFSGRTKQGLTKKVNIFLSRTPTKPMQAMLYWNFRCIEELMTSEFFREKVSMTSKFRYKKI